MVVVNESDFVAHYGVIRRSGRYPWGSGGNESLELSTVQEFLGYIEYLKKKLGLSDTEVAADLGISTTTLRAKKSIAKNEQKQQQIIEAQRLKDKGYSNVAAAERMGIPESTYRTLLEPGAKDKADILQSTANMLKEEVDAKTFVDVGSGVENHLGISDTKLRTAVAVLQEQGYVVESVPVRQLGTGKDTYVKVLAPPGTTWGEIMKNRGEIQQLRSWSEDGGRSFDNPAKYDPLTIDPDRVGVRYKEDGGATADGVIYVRPGVSDVSLGASSYAQVRVKVGDGHYLKGMAVYKDDLPEGVDLLFNTNKSDTGNKLDAMKPLTDDPDLPFGALTRPLLDKPGATDAKVTSVMNIVNEEGDWGEWAQTLSSQMLSKQNRGLVKTQLDMTYDQRQKEFDEIMNLTNPVVKRKLLLELADGTDSAAVHLKAAPISRRQGSHVILPVDSINPTEVYAPNFIDGETVVLIRHPHGGVFEIPELRVNNKNREARKLLGQAPDAIGIHHKVAEQLSGADFDGDTVLVIPNNNPRKKVKAARPIQDLVDFDPRSSYPGYEGMKPMTNTQTEMGKISNLITDMTIKQASQGEIVRAVKHSMVVIDAEKHGLNYKQSEIDNGIRALKQKYQTKPDGSSGASTLISRAKSRVYVPDRKDRPMSEGGPIDTETGRRVFVETGKLNYRTGQPVRNRVKALEVTDDAHDLSSGTPIERLYADHSNRLKGLANRARLEAINTPASDWSPSAKKVYAAEVESLNFKLNEALKNRPRERQAQIIANANLKLRRDANPEMDDDDLKKARRQELERARARTGAKKDVIEITPSEWRAIQEGAISSSKLATILDNADMDKVRELATPRTKTLMTDAKVSRARQMFDSGYTRAEVAAQLGVSLSTLDRSLSES